MELNGKIAPLGLVAFIIKAAGHRQRRKRVPRNELRYSERFCGDQWYATVAADQRSVTVRIEQSSGTVNERRNQLAELDLEISRLKGMRLKPGTGLKGVDPRKRAEEMAEKVQGREIMREEIRQQLIQMESAGRVDILIEDILKVWPLGPSLQGEVTRRDASEYVFQPRPTVTEDQVPKPPDVATQPIEEPDEDEDDLPAPQVPPAPDKSDETADEELPKPKRRK